MAPLTLLNLPQEVFEVVTENFSQYDLSQFMLTCKTAFNSGVRTLYRRNALEDNSSALGWAVRLKDERLALKVIKISLYHRGNIDAQHMIGDTVCTALHIAAARGSQTLTSYLLMRGASPRMRSWNLYLLFPDASALLRGSRWLNNTTFNIRSIETATWHPTLIPYIKKDEAIVNLLIKAGAYSMLISPHLPAVEKNDDGNVVPLQEREDLNKKKPPIPEDRLTMLHASIIMGDEPKIMHHIKHNVQDVGATIIKTLSTPLHIAVAMGDIEAVDALINAGADVNALDFVGNSPLHLSASSSGRELGDFRKPQPKIAKLLLQAGADPNMPALGTRTTPLLALASRVKRDWSTTYWHMKMMFDILIAYGADLNWRDAQRKSVLYYLARAIVTHEDAKGKRNGYDTLEKLFKSFVLLGADISIPGPSNESLTCMIITSHSAPKFQKWFMTLNPQILPHEATTIYRAWIASKNDWYSGYNVCQHAGLVNQRTIDMTIGDIWAKQHDKFQLIRKHFHITADPTWIVWEGQFAHVPSLAHQHPTPLPIIDFHFNVNYKVHGTGFLHMTVQKFVGDRGKHYTQMHAIQDAKQFVHLGIKTDAKNFRGRTPSLLLRETLPRNPDFPYKKLLKYLADAEAGFLAPRFPLLPPV